MYMYFTGLHQDALIVLNFFIVENKKIFAGVQFTPDIAYSTYII